MFAMRGNLLDVMTESTFILENSMEAEKLGLIVRRIFKSNLKHESTMDTTAIFFLFEKEKTLTVIDEHNPIEYATKNVYLFDTAKGYNQEEVDENDEDYDDDHEVGKRLEWYSASALAVVVFLRKNPMNYELDFK